MTSPWFSYSAFLCLLLAVAAPLEGQRLPRIGLEAALVYASVSGDDFQDTDAGLGWDGQVQLGYRAMSLGLGYERSSHHNDLLGEYVTATSLFVEPRFTLGRGGWAAIPYLSVRYSRTELSLDAFIPGLGSLAADQKGYLLLAGPGLSVALASHVRMELALLYGRASFETAKVNGQVLANSQRQGSAFHARAGLSLRTRRW